MGRKQAGHLKKARRVKKDYNEAVETLGGGSRELLSRRAWRELGVLPKVKDVLSVSDFEAAVSAATVSNGPAVQGRLTASTLENSFGGGRLASARGALALLGRLGVRVLENEVLHERAAPLPISRVLRSGEAFFLTLPVQQYAQQIGGLRQPDFLRHAVPWEPTIVVSQTGRHRSAPCDLGVHLDPHLVGIVFHVVTGIKVFYVADNSAENIVRLYANPLTTAITDLAGCKRVVLGPGMAMYAPPGSPHKVYNLTPDKGSLAVSWDFRVPAITIPLLKKLKSLLRRRASREAVIQFAYEVFESEADGYTLAHAEQDIDDELAHLAW